MIDLNSSIAFATFSITMRPKMEVEALLAHQYARFVVCLHVHSLCEGCCLDGTCRHVTLVQYSCWMDSMTSLFLQQNKTPFSWSVALMSWS